MTTRPSAPAQQTPADQADLALVPPVLRLVAEAESLQAALALAERRGGTLMYVPRTAEPHHDLVQDVGYRGLQALCNAYAGEHVMVPKASQLLREMRNRLVRRDRETMSVRELALKYRLDRRNIQRLLADACGQLSAEKPKRPDLFD